MKIKLDINPVSINECFQGRRYFTAKGKEFRELCLWSLPKRIKTITGFTEIKLKFGLKNWLRADLDNKIKPILDCLVKGGIIKDDRYVLKLQAEKVKSEKEFIEIEITKVENNK